MISIHDLFLEDFQAKKWGVVVEVGGLFARGRATNLMPEPCG